MQSKIKGLPLAIKKKILVFLQLGYNPVDYLNGLLLLNLRRHLSRSIYSCAYGKLKYSGITD